MTDKEGVVPSVYPVLKKNNLSYITVEEYLAKEERASVRHEYVNGQVFAMSGATRRHNVIAGNIFSIIHAHLKGSHCRVYMSDVKARVEATNSFYYPDVMVACDKYDKRSVFTAHPVLIVEVLSRSTAAIDRREKVFAYQQIESLQEYMIVYQTKRLVELYSRVRSGQWDAFTFAEGAELLLESIPTGILKLSIESIYADVDWPVNYDLEVQEEVEEYRYGNAALDW